MQIRRKMREIMVREASTVDLKDLVAKFIPQVIGKEIEKGTQGIYLLQNTVIRKVKILKTPKFDLMKLMEEFHFCGRWQHGELQWSKWLRAIVYNTVQCMSSTCRMIQFGTLDARMMQFCFMGWGVRASPPAVPYPYLYLSSGRQS